MLFEMLPECFFFLNKDLTPNSYYSYYYKVPCILYIFFFINKANIIHSQDTDWISVEFPLWKCQLYYIEHILLSFLSIYFCKNDDFFTHFVTLQRIYPELFRFMMNRRKHSLETKIHQRNDCFHSPFVSSSHWESSWLAQTGNDLN